MKKLKTTLSALLAVMIMIGILPQSTVFAADIQVQSLEIVENNYEYIENDMSQGYWLDDITEDGSTEQKFCYYPYVHFMHLKLKATYSDGSTKIFSVLDENGNVKDDINSQDYPQLAYYESRDCIWNVGVNENAYSVKYGNVTIGVPVVVKETTVESIEILKNDYKYIKNDSSTSFAYKCDNGEECIIYLPDRSFQNLSLRIHYKDGSFKDYSYSDRLNEITTNENGELNESPLTFNGYSFNCFNTFDQTEKPWTVGSNNSYTLCYMGVYITVPATVIESPVTAIQVIENPFKYTLNDERLGEYDETGTFIYDETYSFAYGLYKIDYADGTSVYFRPCKAEDLVLLNGYEFVVGNPDQYDKPWTSGNNSYTLCYMGKEVTIPVTVVSDVPVDTSTVFTDVSNGKWYKEFVDEAVTYGLFNGVSETSFDPNGAMNRAMFVQVLANISGIKTDKNAVSGFEDVPAGKWFTGAVAWAAQFEIVNGVSEKEFAPLKNVTREQMCTMLVRYAKHVGIQLEKDTEKKTFSDDGKISNYAKEAVYACQQAKIINGMTETEFAPKETATRAQVAKILSVFHYIYLS